MNREADRVKVYQDTIARLEPDITETDRDAYGTSIAVSLKRIADNLDILVGKKERPERDGKPSR